MDEILKYDNTIIKSEFTNEFLYFVQSIKLSNNLDINVENIVKYYQ